MDLFTATRVTKRFANHTALENVSIAIPGNSIFGLLGPNGAGKTTLIRIMNRIIAPDQGELLFEGKKLEPGDIAKIGYLPEERGLYKKMKVGEQALYLAQLKGITHEVAVRQLKYWFEKFEILSWWNRKVEELSKGMQQKIQFIVTILHEPKLLIFDEPFSGFDPINVNLLKEEILALHRKGVTIVFSTHNMASVEELCSQIALINKSRKILDGNIWDIRKAFKTNTFELQYTGYDDHPGKILPEKFEIINYSKLNEHYVARVRIPVTATTNDLIRELLPHVTIQGLNEIIPSMNDVFIRTVTGQNQPVSA